MSKIIKIALIGAECTGKTSLALALTKCFSENSKNSKSLYIPEFARIYANTNAKIHKRELNSDDIWPIANGQLDLENRYLNDFLQENDKNIEIKYVFYDTTLINTRLYAKLFYNKQFKDLDELSQSQKYDFYFLLDYKNIAWEPDPGQRSAKDLRFVQDAELKRILELDKIKYYRISGDFASRINAIKNIIKNI